MQTSCDVALSRVDSYDADLGFEVDMLLRAVGFAPRPTERVLLKPNLLRTHELACTNVRVVTACAAWLVDHGAKVTVADAPGFGTARGVAHYLGLDTALAPLGLKIDEFRDPVDVPLKRGGAWKVARNALEVDRILCLPRVKAHSQARLTLGVKNLYGCIPGLRKALGHSIYGRQPGRFMDGMVDLLEALPPVASLIDGIIAMDHTGPAWGKPYALGCLGASTSVVALDTAIYQVLRTTPEAIPLWQALRERMVAGAFEENIRHVGLTPDAFSTADFVLPQELMPIAFHSRRLIGSLVRRLWSSWTV